MGPLLWVIGTAVAGFLGYEAMKPKPRFVGDLAKPGANPATADQVEVLVPDLIRSNASIAVGAMPGQIPDGTTSVIVAVLGANKDTLQGPITTFGTVPVGVPVGSVIVNRADVKRVFRNGKIATQTSFQGGNANFAGEASTRFVG